jgi:TonB family protein
VVGWSVLSSASASPLKSMSQAAKPLKNMSARLTNRTPPPPSSFVHEKWALVVAEEKFQDPDISPAPFAGPSAAELIKVLGSASSGRFAPDHIKILTGEKATRSAVEEAVSEWLLKKALPRDLVVLYFCGRIAPCHGGKELSFCTYDTLLSERETSGVPLGELLEEIRHRTQSPYIVCLLDTALARAEESSQRLPNLAAVSAESKVTILSSGSASRSSAGEPVSSSPLSHNLAEALNTSCGMMPLKAVADYVLAHSQGTDAAGNDGLLKPGLTPAVDANDLLTLSLGMVVKSSIPPKKIAIGHPLDNLVLNRQDLTVPRMPPPQTAKPNKEDEEDEEEAANNFDFGSYISQMKHDIQLKWQPPKGFENRRVVVTFVIARNGTISDPSVVESSGVESVDRSALEALKSASPLAPLPLGAPKSVQIKYQFDWHVRGN